MKGAAAVLFVVLLGLAPGLALAAEGPHSLEEMAVESVDSPEEHAAMASHYRAEAEKARESARTHEKMAESYMRGNLTHRERMKRHCQSLAEKYEGVASDYDDLAKLHEEAAKSAQ